MKNPESQLQELLDLVLCGSQTDAQAELLRDLIDAHPQLHPQLIEQLRTHGLLKWMLSPASGSDVTDSLGQQPVGETANSNGGPIAPANRPPPNAARTLATRLAAVHTGSRRWLRATPRGALAVSALATAASLLLAWSWSKPGLDAPEVGRAIAQANVRLSPDSTALGKRGELVPGLLELVEGHLAIEFTTGVKMDVSAPASCEIVSGMLVKLQQGQATADVPRWARGFTIATPDIDVVDLGTRFGVARRGDEATDVVVFEGEVDLKSNLASERRFERRLTQGEAARVDRHGQLERIFLVHGDALGNAWTTLDKPTDQSVIAAVWDNLGATKSVSYYQVIAGGFVEDAPAYVDHPHEWNGRTASGLPELLAGAAYVKTVNDYRYAPELSIHIEFGADAVLYVLFDDRTAPPAWLTSHFIDTGEDVGLDEDAWHGNPTFTVEQGPGVSIDNVFSVWRRPCARGEHLVLGSMGVGREARAMYGLAATPLER